MNQIYYCFVVAFFGQMACNSPKNQGSESIEQTQAGPIHETARSAAPEKTGAIVPPTKDTIHIKGPDFDINGIRSYWLYTLRRENRPQNPDYNLQLISMQLKPVDKDIVLIEPAVSFDLMNGYFSVKELKQYPQAILECKDINKDSWCDYEVLFERAAAGANTTTEAFLFNPENKTFEHNALFSGTNVAYDSVKNMVRTSWKMGYDNYKYTYTYLKANQKEINYIIEEHYEDNNVTVTKLVNGKVVKKTRKLIEE